MDEVNENNTRKFNPFFAIGIVVLLAFVGWIIWLSNEKTLGNSTQQVQPTQETKQNASDSSQVSSEVKTIDVEAGSFYFKPNEIRVKKGQKVKIVLHSVSMMHDFNIDELNVHSPVTKNGDTSTVEFSGSTVGSFEYYCSVGQHRKMGQVGTLVVE